MSHQVSELLVMPTGTRIVGKYIADLSNLPCRMTCLSGGQGHLSDQDSSF